MQPQQEPIQDQQQPPQTQIQEPAPIQEPIQTIQEPAPIQGPIQEPIQGPIQTQIEPIKEPTQTEPIQEPTQTEPIQEPTQTEPIQEPIQGPIQTQIEPIQEPTQTEPIQEPTQTEPIQEPIQTQIQEPIQYQENQQEETPTQIQEPIQEKECISGNKIIEMDTDSLKNEIEMSKIIKEKMPDSKYLVNFSYILTDECTDIVNSKEQEKLKKCNLSVEPNTKYKLCEYTSTPTKTIKEYLKEIIEKLNKEAVKRIILDFKTLLTEALKELYEKTKIVHNSIDENNIIITNDKIPKIKNFKMAITDEIGTSKDVDVNLLETMFENISS